MGKLNQQQFCFRFGQLSNIIKLWLIKCEDLLLITVISLQMKRLSVLVRQNKQWTDLCHYFLTFSRLNH